MLERFKQFVSGLFYEYDPWKVSEWRGTPEERDRLNKYLDDYRMTADEVVSMKSQRPF
jgi:hypothetical protein